MEYKITPIKPFGLLLEPTNTRAINDLNIENLRQLFWQEQLLILRGFDTFKQTEDFAQYCESWGEISLWPFGKVLELIEQDKPKDHIFDNSYIPLHWDGMYRHQIPEFQIFHCVAAPQPGQGGRTVFSNTLLALKYTSAETKAFWDKVTGIYQRKMEFYHSKTKAPIINSHPYQNISVIRYNEPHSQDKGYFVNPPILEFTGISEKELEAFHYSLRSALYNPNNFYAHEWCRGDVVIADNFSLLHGREPFVAKSPRHLQRVHVLSSPPFDNPGLEFCR